MKIKIQLWCQACIDEACKTNTDKDFDKAVMKVTNETLCERKDETQIHSYECVGCKRSVQLHMEVER